MSRYTQRPHTILYYGHRTLWVVVIYIIYTMQGHTLRRFL